MNEIELPHALIQLLRLLDDEVPAQAELTLGAVTFHAMRGLAQERWIDGLIAKRWGTMPPELVPFATDAFGNLFCLHYGAHQRQANQVPVVYWMYETTLVVPVATNFTHFLEWVGLVAEIRVRRGTDDLHTRAHYDQVVEPTLKRLGVERDFFALTTSPLSPVGSLHQGMLRVDPSAPGSRLVAARRAQMDNRQRDAIVHARTALASFPEFLAALWFLVTFDNAPIRVIGWKDLVRRLLRMPLVYRGDLAMAEFVELPSPSLADIASLAAEVLTPGEAAEDPVAELMLYDAVYEPENWLSVAVELANMNRYEQAHTAALNATYLASDMDVLEDIWRFQLDLYQELDWAWHATVMRRQLDHPTHCSELYKRIF